MYWDVKTVKPLPDYQIYVEVEDGRKGIFDLNPYAMPTGLQEQHLSPDVTLERHKRHSHAGAWE